MRVVAAVHLDLAADPHHRVGHEKTIRGIQT
jgi:hypothetical protein